MCYVIRSPLLKVSHMSASEGGLSIQTTELNTHVSLCETVIIILLFNTINATCMVSLLTFGSHQSTS